MTDWRQKALDASVAPWPRAPWDAAPPAPRVVQAWQLACLLRAMGLDVEGRGSRLVVTRGDRRAVLDVCDTTWWANGRPVPWGEGAERELLTAADVGAWLVDGVEPPARADEAGVPDVFWGAEVPGRRG